MFIDMFHSNGLSNGLIMDNTVLLAKVNRNPHIMAHLIGNIPVLVAKDSPNCSPIVPLQ